MVKKVLKVLAVVIVAAIIVLQFFRIDKNNPAVARAETLEATTVVPPDISLIIGRSCNDCHSNQTIYPWYANLQPMGCEIQYRTLPFRGWHLNCVLAIPRRSVPIAGDYRHRMSRVEYFGRLYDSGALLGVE